MTIFDTILIVIIAGFGFYGLFFGLIRMIGNIVGILAGTFVASHYYEWFSQYTSWASFGSVNTSKIISFIILLTITSAIVGIIFYIVEKIFNLISIIPFVKSINRLTGLVFGLLLGSLLVGLLIFFASRYSIITSFFGQVLVDSRIAPLLARFVNILSPLMPDALKALQSLI